MLGCVPLGKSDCAAERSNSISFYNGEFRAFILARERLLSIAGVYALPRLGKFAETTLFLIFAYCTDRWLRPAVIMNLLGWFCRDWSTRSHCISSTQFRIFILVFQLLIIRPTFSATERITRTMRSSASGHAAYSHTLGGTPASCTIVA